ncbi:MAG: hypothetical protein U5J83_16875 [Bryobacterales bacterium]|nr:hypothetical protein [Bryobacterales bacterium]
MAEGRAADETLRRPLRPEYAEALRIATAATVETLGMSLFVPPVQGRSPMVAKVPGVETDDFSIVGTDANILAASRGGSCAMAVSILRMKPVAARRWP